MKHLMTILAIVVLASVASYAAPAPASAFQNFTLTVQGAPLTVAPAASGSVLTLTASPNTTPNLGLIANFTVTGEPLYNFDVTWTTTGWVATNPLVNPTVLVDLGGSANTLNNVLSAAGTLDVAYTHAGVTIPVGGYGVWTNTITCTVAYSAGWF